MHLDKDMVVANVGMHIKCNLPIAMTLASDSECLKKETYKHFILSCIFQVNYHPTRTCSTVLLEMELSVSLLTGCFGKSGVTQFGGEMIAPNN